MEDNNVTTENLAVEKKSDDEENSTRKKAYKISGYGILFCKILLLLFAISTISLYTWRHTIYPYSLLLVGFEFSIGLIFIFQQIRRSTYSEDKPENIYQVSPEKDELKLLLQDLEWDIKRYEQSSRYYFSQVRRYKYFTVLLASISTIILGLDIQGLNIMFFDLTFDYKTFAKNTAFIIGAIITAMTSLMTYWNLEKYWFTNKTIVNELRTVRDRTNMLCARGNATEDDIKELFKFYQSVKEKFLKYWEGALGDRGGQTTK